MKRVIYFSIIAVFFTACKKEAAETNADLLPDVSDLRTEAAGDKYMFLAEQSQNRYGFVNVTQAVWWWTWKAGVNNNIPSGSVSWFNGPNDIKPVFSQQYVILCGQSGGIAIVRISNKQAVFYVYYPGNIHSVEILPDGNLVAASSGLNSSSTADDSLVVFKVGSSNFPNGVYRKAYAFPGVHNVVWDLNRGCLWAAGTTDLRKYTYNFSCSTPALTSALTVALPVQPGNAHDLFPVYGKDSLHLSTGGKLWYFDPKHVNDPSHGFIYIKDMAGVKSITSGPAGYATGVQKCISSSAWWNEKIIDMFNPGTNIYYESGSKIYKGRWKLNNQFSYPANHSYTVCN